MCQLVPCYMIPPRPSHYIYGSHGPGRLRLIGRPGHVTNSEQIFNIKNA